MKKLLVVLFTMLMLIGCAGAVADDVHVGDMVLFGRYEQDGVLENGAEPIEWIVIGIQDDHAILLSRYGLDNKPFNSSKPYPTWAASDLRAWLNDSFFTAAFNDAEREAVVLTQVRTEMSADDLDQIMFAREWGPFYNDDFVEPVAEDHVYVLSMTEAKAFGGCATWAEFNEACEALITEPTAYALEHGARAPVDYGGWWLRSPFFYDDLAAGVGYSGCLIYFDVDRNDVWVRPAMTVDLNALN